VVVLTYRHKQEASAQSPDAEWRFAITGLFRRQASIRLIPSDKLLATCRLSYWTSQGTLPIRPNLSLSLTANSWDKTYTVTTHRGELVLLYDFRGLFTLRAPLTWGPASTAAEDFPWLIPFAWFLAVRHYRDVIEAAGGAVFG
jgi:hypothetical protein